MKNERKIRDAITAAGGELLSIGRNRHIKTEIRRPNGTRFTLTWACSSGDERRGWKNQMTLLKRRMEEAT